MTFPKARLVVAAVLFVSWLGYLLFLVVESGSIVLSRPQFLVAQVYVIAEIGRGEEGGLSPSVKIEEVLWSADPNAAKFAQTTIELPQLANCDKKQGNEGPGKYIIPLQQSRGRPQITPIPGDIFRIYPLTAATRHQVDAIIQSKK